MIPSDSLNQLTQTPKTANSVNNNNSQKTDSENKTTTIAAEQIPKKEKSVLKKPGFLARKLAEGALGWIQEKATKNLESNKKTLKDVFGEGFSEISLSQKIDELFPLLQTVIPAKYLPLLMSKDKEAKEATYPLVIHVLTNLVNYTYPNRPANLMFDQFITDFSVKFSQKMGSEFEKIDSKHYNKLFLDESQFYDFSEALLAIFLPDKDPLHGGILVKTFINPKEKIKKKIASALKDQWKELCIKQSIWLMENRLNASNIQGLHAYISDLSIEKIYPLVFNFLPLSSQLAFKANEQPSQQLKAQASYIFNALFSFTYGKLAPKEPILLKDFTKAFQDKLGNILNANKSNTLNVKRILSAQENLSQEEENFIFACSQSIQKKYEEFYKTKNRNLLTFVEQITSIPKFEENKQDLNLDKQASELFEFVQEAFSKQFKKRGEEYFRSLTDNDDIPKIVSQLTGPLYKLAAKYLSKEKETSLESSEDKEALNKQTISALVLQLFKNLLKDIPRDQKISSQALTQNIVDSLLKMFKEEFDILNQQRMEDLKANDLNPLAKKLLMQALPEFSFIKNFITRREDKLCEDISTALFEVYKTTRPKESDLELYKEKLRKIIALDSSEESEQAKLMLERSINQLNSLSNNLASFIKKVFSDLLKTEHAVKKQLFDLLANVQDDSFQELASIIQGVVAAENSNYTWIDSQLQSTLEQAIFKGLVMLLEKTTKGEKIPQEKLLGAMSQYLLNPCLDQFPKILASFPKTDYKMYFQTLVPYMEQFSLQKNPLDEAHLKSISEIIDFESKKNNWPQNVSVYLEGVKFKDLKEKVTPHLNKLELKLDEDMQATIIAEVLSTFNGSTLNRSYKNILEKLYQRLFEADRVLRLEEAQFKHPKLLLAALKDGFDKNETIKNYLNYLQFESAQENWSQKKVFEFSELLADLKALDPESSEEKLKKIFTEVGARHGDKEDDSVILRDLYLEVVLERENRVLQQKVNDLLKGLPKDILSDDDRQEMMRGQKFTSYLKELYKESSILERSKISDKFIQQLTSGINLRSRRKLAQAELNPFIEKLFVNIFNDPDKDLSFHDYLPLHPKIKDRAGKFIIDQVSSVLSQFFVIFTDGILEIPQSREKLKQLYHEANPEIYGKDNPGNLARAAFIVSQITGPAIAYACREEPEKLLDPMIKKLALACNSPQDEMDYLRNMLQGLITDIGDAYHQDTPKEFRSLFAFIGQLSEGFILKTFIDATDRLAEKEKLIAKDQPSLLEQETLKILEDVTKHCTIFNEVKGTAVTEEEFKKKFKDKSLLTNGLEIGLAKYSEKISPDVLAFLNIDESSLPVPALFHDILWELMEKTIAPIGLEKAFTIAIDTISWNKGIMALINQIDKKPAKSKEELKERIRFEDHYQKDLRDKITSAAVAIIQFQPSPLLHKAIKNKKVSSAIGDAIAISLREFVRPEIDKPLKIQDLLDMGVEVAADKVHLCRWNNDKQEFEFLDRKGNPIDKPNFSDLLPDGDEEKERVKLKAEQEKKEILESVPKQIARLVNFEADKRVKELYELLWDSLIGEVDKMIENTFHTESGIERAKKYIHKILKVLVGIPLKIMSVLFRFLIWIPLRFFVKSWVKKQTHGRVKDVNNPIHGNLLIKTFDRYLAKG